MKKIAFKNIAVISINDNLILKKKKLWKNDKIKKKYILKRQNKYCKKSSEINNYIKKCTLITSFNNINCLYYVNNIYKKITSLKRYLHNKYSRYSLIDAIFVYNSYIYKNKYN